MERSLQVPARVLRGKVTTLLKCVTNCKDPIEIPICIALQVADDADSALLTAAVLVAVLLTLRRLAWLTREARTAITRDALGDRATREALEAGAAAVVRRFVNENSFADARLAELFPVRVCAETP